MNAVVLVVKASYVASTKYRKSSAGAEKPSLVVWRMKAPEKKPLVRREAPDEVKAKIRKGNLITNQSKHLINGVVSKGNLKSRITLIF